MLKKPLWHDAKEEPDHHLYTIFMHGCSGVQLCCLVRRDSPYDCENSSVEVLFFRFDGWFYETWNETVKRNRIISWCYFNELAFHKPILEVP